MKIWKKRTISVLLAVCMIFAGLSVSALAAPASAPAPIPFFDVAWDAWYYSAALDMHRRNIMLGTSPGSFAPHADMSRAMAVAALFRLEHGRLANNTDSRNNPFHDVSINAWFAPYVSWAYRNDIVEGVAGAHFAPHEAVSREAFVMMLYRYADLGLAHGTPNFPAHERVSDWAAHAVQWAVAHEFLRGSGGRINGQGVASRAECATILMRFIAWQE